MAHNNGGAMTLAKTIEGILNHGVGPMNIPLDDIRVAMRKVPVRSARGWHSLTLDEARDFIDRHLSTALGILGDDGWSSVKTTQHWEDIGYAEPNTESEIKRCIAGIGRASAAVGLHFMIEEDFLFLYAREHGARVWRGKRGAELDRLTVASDNGHLSVGGLTLIERSAAEPGYNDKLYRKDMKNLPLKP